MDVAHGDGKQFDLLIVNDDIAIGSDGEPLTIDGRPSIAQDIAHLIRESNLLIELIGERDVLLRRAIYQRVEMLVETDARITPGTARVIDGSDGTRSRSVIWVQARTYDYQDIAFYL